MYQRAAQLNNTDPQLQRKIRKMEEKVHKKWARRGQSNGGLGTESHFCEDAPNALDPSSCLRTASAAEENNESRVNVRHRTLVSAPAPVPPAGGGAAAAGAAAGVGDGSSTSGAAAATRTPCRAAMKEYNSLVTQAGEQAKAHGNHAGALGLYRRAAAIHDSDPKLLRKIKKLESKVAKAAGDNAGVGEEGAGKAERARARAGAGTGAGRGVDEMGEAAATDHDAAEGLDGGDWRTEGLDGGDWRRQEGGHSPEVEVVPAPARPSPAQPGAARPATAAPPPPAAAAPSNEWTREYNRLVVRAGELAKGDVAEGDEADFPAALVGVRAEHASRKGRLC